MRPLHANFHSSVPSEMVKPVQEIEIFREQTILKRNEKKSVYVRPTALVNMGVVWVLLKMVIFVLLLSGLVSKK